MLTGAVGLRMRDVPIIANLTMAVLLIFCGVNVPLDKLPDWMHAIAEALPMTHAIAAARKVADGASLASVAASAGRARPRLGLPRSPASPVSAGSNTRAAGTAPSIAHEIPPSRSAQASSST